MGASAIDRPAALLAGLALCTVFGWGVAGRVLAQQGVALGEQVPDFVVHDLDGRQVHFEALRRDAEGKPVPVVVTFWSYKCPSGRRAMDRFAALAAAAKENKARLLAICAYGESREQLAAYAREHALDYVLYHDPGAAVARLLDAEVVTETFVIDAEGRLVYRGGLGDAKNPYPERALAQLRAGDKVDPAQTRAFG
ncbi:MAG: hypothetical protein KatS3mg102_1999 [Planctomycetota bacterium]|nr:MAG: hypothetical protein KatS3mg102_1999 [Planctomycetota bacterium]